MASWLDDLPLGCRVLVSRIVAEARWEGPAPLARQVRDYLMRWADAARINEGIDLGTGRTSAL